MISSIKTLTTCLIILSSAIALSACGDVEENLWEENRALWDSHNLQNYKYTVTFGCYCSTKATSPFEVTVKNGVVEEAIYLESSGGMEAGTQVEEASPFREDPMNAFTITGRFDVLQTALSTAEEATVHYDSALGYPKEVHLDYLLDYVDDEVSMRIENFELIQGS